MAGFPSLWGGAGFGQGPVEQSVQGMLGPNAQFTAATQPDLLDKLMNAVGHAPPPKMPCTTFGAPAGSAPAMMGSPVSPMIPQTQMPPPRGIPNLAALLNPTAGAGAGNQGLMAQYMALQQLMRGA
jgi:hypothetical protein